MFDIRLLSTHSRVAFVGLFASTMATTIAMIILVCFGLHTWSVAFAVALGVGGGAAATRAVELWKMKPLTARIWARRRSMTAPGETGRLLRVAERASVDQHLDALLVDIDGMARELGRAELRCQALEAREATAKRELKGEQARSAEALKRTIEEHGDALASHRLLVKAGQNELGTLEQLFRRFIIRPVGKNAVARSHAEAFPDLMRAAGDMLDRLRGMFSVAGHLAQRDPTPQIVVPAAQTRLGLLLPKLARGVSLRLERDVLVRIDETATVSAVAQDWILSVPLTVALDTLGQIAPPRAAIMVEATQKQGPESRYVEVRVTWFHLDGTAGVLSPDPLATLTAEIRAHLQSSAPEASFEMGEEGLVFRLPAVSMRMDTDIGLRTMATYDGRSILVIDPYAPRRTIFCEQLSARRLVPTAASSLDEAVLRIRDAERARRNFQYICIIPDASAEMPVGDIWSTKLLDAFLARHEVAPGCKIISLPHISATYDERTGDSSGDQIARVARPVSTTHLLNALASPRVAPPTIDPLRRRRQTHVLIGEDNAVTQLHLQRLLELRGITSFMAHNGAEVVDRFLTDPPGTYDAVLLDIQMPVMDGHEAAQILRAREARDGLVRVPIIAVTAHAMASERTRCLHNGMDEHITKPIDPETLFSTLGRLTGRRFEQAALIQSPAQPPSLPKLAPSTPLKAAPEPQRDAAPAPVPEATSLRFNREHLMEFAGGDPGFLRKLSEIFGRTAPKQVADLATARREGDLDKVRQLAHQLKGAVGNFGAESAQQLAARIERGAGDKVTDTLDVDIEALRADVDWIRDALVAIADEHSPES